MITMKNFRVLVPEKKDALLGYTGENLSRRLTIVVDDLGTWAYKLDIRNDAGVANIMDMTAGDGVIYVDIERAALQVSGRVQAQVRAIAGDAVKCSNIFSLFIGDSVQAVNYFESLPPSEFEQLEANMTAIKSEAQASARKAKESENNAKAYAEGGTVQTTTYDESGNLVSIKATEVTGAKGYQSKAAENAASAQKLMLRAKAYAEGGAVEQESIGNVLYPAVDTIGAKGYMEQAQEAADRAEGAAERAEAAASAAEAAQQQVAGVVANAADAVRAEVAADADRAEEAADRAEAASGLPAGGSAGDVLTKTASGTKWQAPSGGIPVPATAEVGQFLAVKAVDDNGKPTDWEVADVPEGTKDYTVLENKPQINGVELVGNKTSADLGIADPTDEQVATSVEAWLDSHPEATTTVADGSINPDKTTWMRQVWHNIFDVSTIKDGYFFYDSDDKTTGGGTADYFVSDYIPVVAGREYVFSHRNMTLRWTDANKTFISGSASTVSVAGQKVTAPDDAAFVRFSLIKAGLTPEEVQAQVYEYMGEVWEYDTYKNLYSIVVTDAGYSKAIADLVEGKFVDGSLAPADLFADESILYKQMKGWDEFHWNLVDPNSLEVGLLYDDGTEREFADTETGRYRRTKYVPVTAGETLHFLGFSLFLYDSEKNFISKLDQSSGKAVVPDGAAYIRAYSYKNDGTIPGISIYRCGYGRNFIYNSVVSYDESIPRFTVPDVLEAYKCYLGIHPWADKNFGIIGDSFTAPGTWCNIMRENLKAASLWIHAISGANFSDADGVPKTAYEQAQEMVADGNTPDVILVTMGTNDANNSRMMGEIVESNSISDFDLTTYTGGMQACLNYLQNNFPEAIIYVGWTPMGGLVNGTKAEYLTRMQDVCLMYGVEYIETRTCGVTRFSDVYAECYERGVNGGHPTGVGQQKIGAYMTRLLRGKA